MDVIIKDEENFSVDNLEKQWQDIGYLNSMPENSNAYGIYRKAMQKGYKFIDHPHGLYRNDHEYISEEAKLIYWVDTSD